MVYGGKETNKRNGARSASVRKRAVDGRAVVVTPAGARGALHTMTSTTRARRISLYVHSPPPPPLGVTVADVGLPSAGHALGRVRAWRGGVVVVSDASSCTAHRQYIQVV